MSFKYRGSIVTLSNYQEIFKGLSLDYLDEIRLAIMDDTPIGTYINRAVSYEDGVAKLSEVRKSLRVHVPKRFISLGVSSDVTRAIRLLFEKKGEAVLMELSPYLDVNGVSRLPDNTLKSMVVALASEGVSLSEINFLNVPVDNIPYILVGLIKKYPMWLVAEYSNINSDTMNELLRAFTLGVDVLPFTVGTWDAECVTLLLSAYKKVDLPSIMEHINYMFEKGQLTEIIQAYESKLDFGVLCLKGEDGTPLFNEYQMNVLRRCLENDVLTEEIYDYTKSDMEMQDLFDIEMSKKTGKRLGGSLRKH